MGTGCQIGRRVLGVRGTVRGWGGSGPDGRGCESGGACGVKGRCVMGKTAGGKGLVIRLGVIVAVGLLLAVGVVAYRYSQISRLSSEVKGEMLVLFAEMPEHAEHGEYIDWLVLEFHGEAFEGAFERSGPAGVGGTLHHQRYRDLLLEAMVRRAREDGSERLAQQLGIFGMRHGIGVGGVD